ncbi:MAG: COG2827: putative endonuclease containing a URI domain [uncultured Sulfurovum sp.]|uniref:COG2827: putative endonuclease containing a URI domain n=1 Tax=uncultured Sulfurovum sp. TaxID=269237 RepID=A0A6S6SW65_9BACT|nr:MAG: COG2827: putative endonuclease containing a URI domain [uncultured Sulfurovum sp.]
MYFVYILECVDKTLYTGITTDLERRLYEHNNTTKGAKYTRTRRPVVLVYSQKVINRSIATKREIIIKKMNRTKKLLLINYN